MKTKIFLLLTLVFGLMTEAFAQKSRPMQYIFAPDIPDDILTPSKISSLVGRDSQSRPTWGNIETPSGDSTIVSGYIKPFGPDTNKKYFTCIIDTTKFAFLKSDFVMKGNILFDPLGNKQEALLLEFDTCLCANKLRIKYNKRDSLAKNIGLPIKRVVEDVEVRSRRSSLPSISSHAIDSVSRSGTFRYLLVPVLSDGTSCTMFWLNRELHTGPMVMVTEIIYELSYEDGRKLVFDDEGYTLDGKRVTRFDVVEEVDVKVGGEKKLKHKKRTAHF